MPVFPRWVTQLAAVLLLVAGVCKAIAELLPQFPDVAMWIALLAGVLGVLGKALGDTDGDGVPNAIDPD